MNFSDCYKCHKPGHFTHECPSNEINSGGNRGRDSGVYYGTSCYNCEKTGHLSRDCNDKYKITHAASRIIAAVGTSQYNCSQEDLHEETCKTYMKMSIKTKEVQKMVLNKTITEIVLQESPSLRTGLKVIVVYMLITFLTKWKSPGLIPALDNVYTSGILYCIYLLLTNDGGSDLCDDTDAEAVACRMESLTSGAKGLMLSDDLEKSSQERLDLFYKFVKRHKETGKIENLQKVLVGEADRLDIKGKAVLVLCELLLGEHILQEVKTHRLLFLRFTHGSQNAQKYLLGGLEQVINLHKDSLMSKVPHILKLFYDTDILEEEVLIDWSEKVSNKYVSKKIAQAIHEKAKPFIKWLQEAEEEESSSDEVDNEAVESYPGTSSQDS